MNKLTKIVATIGPASNSEETIRELIKTGVNTFRLNFSHGDHDWHRNLSNTIRKVATEFDQGISILQDLAGPKLRTGKFDKTLTTLTAGDTLELTSEDIIGDESKVGVNYPELIQQVSIGQILRLDDGKLSLEVVEKRPSSVITKIIEGGEVRSRRGINVPGLALDINVFTDKDQCDLEYWPTDNPDWISLSFVQSSDDILNLKNHLQNKGSNSNVMAKIETSAAVENIDSIIEASDGIMVARGDLAAETPIEEVPVLQNRIINLARQANKPVIVATQMMDSMIHNPLPTRAEVTDVSTAILDGADAIMLSAETATGDHPVKVVNMMAKIAEVTESSNLFKNRLLHNLSSHSKAGSAAASITAFAKAQNAKAIVVITQSGAMARAVSRLRPGLPIIAITIDITIGRQLAMYHGVWSRHTTDLPDTDSELRSWLPDYLVKHSYLNRGDTILASFGQQIHKSGSTDTITLITI